jgi:hypothetical protein
MLLVTGGQYLHLIEEVYTVKPALLWMTGSAKEVRNASRRHTAWMVVRYAVDVERSKQTL